MQPGTVASILLSSWGERRERERERERGKVIMATVVMMTHLLKLDAVRLNEISEAVVYHFCEIMIEF